MALAKEFKQGDYIVILEVVPRLKDDVNFKTNHIYMQRGDDYCLRVPVDSTGIRNGWASMKADGSSGLLRWRYGTAGEIAEYVRRGKPFDVTTLTESSDSIEVGSSEELFSKGELVVVTHYRGRSTWKDYWFKPGEIVELGGKYWRGSSPKRKKDLVRNFDAKSGDNPSGNGLYASEDSFDFRRATSREVEYFREKGLGACISGMEQKPVYKFNEGDIIVALEFKGQSRWTSHWFKPGEIMELGGVIWKSKSREKIDSMVDFAAKCGMYPEGNGMRDQTGLKIRHATTAEREFFRKVGLGHTIHEMEDKTKLPGKFLKGDYIVCTGMAEYAIDPTTTGVGWVTKQRETHTSLSVESGRWGEPNGFNKLDYDKKESGWDWRYATSEEIAEYDRRGRSYHIDDLQPSQTHPIKKTGWHKAVDYHKDYWIKITRVDDREGYSKCWFREYVENGKYYIREDEDWNTSKLDFQPSIPPSSILEKGAIREGEKSGEKVPPTEITVKLESAPVESRVREKSKLSLTIRRREKITL